MTTEQFEELAAGYVLNALSPEEQELFKKALESASEEQIRYFEALSSAAAQLAVKTPHKEPAPGVKQLLMQRIKETASHQTQPNTADETDEPVVHRLARLLGLHNPAFALAAVVLLFLTTTVSLWFAITDYHTPDQVAEITISQPATLNDITKVLHSPRMAYADLSGTDALPNGYGKVIWCQLTEVGFLQLANIEALPEGYTYQLWLYQNEEPLSVTVFHNRESRYITLPIDHMVIARATDIDAFAVTIESEGGSNHPSGEPVLYGKI